MLERFWLAAALFHAGLLIACAAFLRRRLRSVSGAAGGVPGPSLVLDTLALLGVSIFLASLGPLIGPPGAFTILRFLAQGLFGEGVVLLGLLAVLSLRRGLRAAGLVASVLSASLLAVYVEAYHREPTSLQVRTHEVDLGRFPEEPLRLLHVSDFQADTIGPYEESVLTAAIEQKPDLVVFTGDFVQPRIGEDRGETTRALRPLLRRLAAVPGLGAYAVRGDVDADWPEVLRETGIRPLEGESVSLVAPNGTTVTLVGLPVGMSRGNDRGGLRRLLRRAGSSDVRIVLGHNPNFAQDLVDLGLGADLVLAGHTHGGQVVLPLLGPPMTLCRLPRLYASGLHDFHGLRLHVSAGSGMERGAAPQIRFLCPPEICLLELR